MNQTNQPAPYFVRRTPHVDGQTIDIRDYSIVEDQVHPLRDYWLIAKRHRWLILSCALVFYIGAALYALTRTPLYTAETTVLIERKAPQILNLRDAQGETDYNDYNNEFYKTQYEILKSRALAERVVRDQGLERHPLFGGGKTAQATRGGLISGIWTELKNSAQGVLPARQKPAPSKTQDPIPLSTRLAGQYLSMLEIRPVAGTSLVVIKITSTDPALSARLADAHASSYVRYGIDLRSQTNSEAGEFLQQKLTELKERIEQSEAALNSYRKEKGIISVDDKSNVILERLFDLNKGLTVAEGERIAWEALMRAARGRNAEEVPSVRNSALIGSLKGELTKLEAEYASLAKEFKAGYPLLDNLRERIDEIRRRMSAEIDREVKSIEAGYAAASNKESQLRVALDEQKRTTLDLKDSAVQYAILAREVDTNKQLYDGVLSRLKEIGVAAEVRNSNIHVMGKALPPGGPSYPDKRRMMMMGLLLGLAGGIGLALLLEQLDNTLKTPEEAERYLRLASLGMIPDFGAVNGRSNGFVAKLLQSAHAELSVANRKTGKDSQSGVLLDQDPLSVLSEAYRSFRSALLLSQAGGPPHTMLVTSAGRGDGKTTTLVNTAIVFAQLGIRVVIIDADLRRPRCHTLLRAENKAGLSDLLAGQLDLGTAIRSTPAENLFLISAGAVPPNPAELLGSQKMHELLEQLREQFEFVFIDSSPLLAVTDSVFLSTMVDGTLLVVNSRTPKPLVKKAQGRLALSQSKVLGMLLNRVDIHSNEYGGYYQQYYTYYRDDDSRAANGNPRFVENGKGAADHDDGNGNGAWSPGSNGHSSAMPDPNGGEKTGNGFGDFEAKVSDTKLPMSAFILSEEQVVERGDISGLLSPVSEPPGKLPTKFPGENLPAEFLDTLGEKLLGAMGPMAPIVLREGIRNLGDFSRSISRPQLEDLTKELGKEILDDNDRQRFVKEMSEEIEKLSSPANVGVLEKTTAKATVKNEHYMPESLKIISAKLSEVIGPIAPLVMRERIAALGETAETFKEAKIGELIGQVSVEIFDELARREFQKEMAKQIVAQRAKGKGQSANNEEPGAGSRERGATRDATNANNATNAEREAQSAEGKGHWAGSSVLGVGLSVNAKSESRRSEVGDQTSEVSGQVSEVRGQMSETSSQRSSDAGARSEEQSAKSEGQGAGNQRSDARGQKPAESAERGATQNATNATNAVNSTNAKGQGNGAWSRERRTWSKEQGVSGQQANGKKWFGWGRWGKG